LEVCKAEDIPFIIPGGEAPLSILGGVADRLKQEGVSLIANEPRITELFTDKLKTFAELERLGFPAPRTVVARSVDDLETLPYPCVVKPATGSGGSSLVFLVQDPREARSCLAHIALSGRESLVQEYVPEDEGEFTVGVLALPGGEIAGSIALKRLFHCKLSVALKSKAGLISSGYSQGLIDDFPEVRKTAEAIARATGCTGPINVQGRVRRGTLLPFEINPRFSASTYLRALAGFNEIDLYLQSVRTGTVQRPGPLRYGYYLRSLCETYVPLDGVKS
jgi:carbamoyl-phosphate synthase large subunit